MREQQDFNLLDVDGNRSEADLLAEADGWEEEDIPPGTKWEDIPDGWACPDCGDSKADFEVVEVSA